MTELSGTIEVLDEEDRGEEQDDRGDRRRRQVVKIDNRESGDTIRLRVRTDTILDSVIAAMYEKFHLSRQTGDRLTCRHDGADVFQYAALTLEQYLDAGHCPSLRWSFVGDTGGA